MSGAKETRHSGFLVIQDLTLGVDEAEQALSAIRRGEIDALIVNTGAQQQVFLLKGADQAHQILLETLNEGAMTISTDGTILYANSRLAAMLGRPRADVLGARLQGFIAPSEATRFAALLSDAARGSSRGEFMLSRMPEGEIPVMISTHVVRMEGAETVFTGVVTDLAEIKQAQSAMQRAHDELSRVNASLVAQIAERERLEAELRRTADELREMGKRKDEFLSILAHELRNPLAPILNAVEVLRVGAPSNPTVERYRDVIERQVQKMARMIDDLLDISRITQGKTTLRLEPTELLALIRNAVDSIRPQILAGNRRLNISAPLVSIWLNADPMRLEQVFANLLNNAVKFTDSGGQIGIVVIREDDHVVIKVSDDGVGIAPAILPRIFDLFVQEDCSLARSAGGLGIGLTVAKKLIEMHGGTILAESAGLKQGSTFTLRLPIPNGPTQKLMAHDASESACVRDVNELPAERQQPSAAASKELGKSAEEELAKTRAKRVLIVEDRVDSAHTLRDLLEIWGYEVCVALNGEEAIRVAPGFRPHIALVDIGLPGIDGYEVARQLRRMTWSERQPGVPIPAPSVSAAGPEEAEFMIPLLVAITGYGQKEARLRATEAGFDCHIVKPADLDELKRILEAGRGATSAA